MPPEEKWIVGRWSSTESEVKRSRRWDESKKAHAEQSLTLTFPLPSLPEKENESESMIEDKIAR